MGKNISASKELASKELEGEETLYNDFCYSDEVYPLESIRIEKGRMSLFEIKRRCERGDIILNPEFQRNKVWDKKQESELIESILMGIPIPIIYLFQARYGYIQVVDGRQRIATAIDFMNNKFGLIKLSIMKNIKKEAKFKELEPIQQRKIEDYQIDIYIIQPPTPERVKFDIFDRVNRGGTKLNNQEMRNALYYGQSTKLIKELSELNSFKKATGNSLNPKQMKDRYVALRFISFYLYFSKQLGDIEYKGNIDDFLADTMQFLNKADSAILVELKDIFDKTMKFAYKYFGSDVFRFNNDDNKNKRPVNMALFECLGFAFAICVQNNLKIDAKALDALKDTFDKSGNFKSGLDVTTNVENRFKQAKNLIGNIK
ncbi:DUF262 domain-containing protein [Helicobacter sp. 23-1044]